MNRWLACLVALLLPLHAGAQEDEAEREGGIVGTGIAGTIRDIGSIHVNGHWIELPEHLVVESVLGPVPASDLKVGDIVAANVEHGEDGWTAVAAAEIFPVVGPVSDVEDGILVVLGTVVRPLPGVSIEGIEIGDWVAVSGLCRVDGVMASRVEEVAPQPRAAMIGSVLEFDETGTLLIGGTRVTGPLLSDLPIGAVIRIEGQPDGDELRAEAVDLGLFPIEAQVVHAEGYPSRPLDSGVYTLLGTGIVGTSASRDLDVREMTYACGVDGSISDQASFDADVRRALDLLGCPRS